MAADEIFVFDAYGTLFDVHSAAARLSEKVGPTASRLSEVWRIKQLEYTWIYAAAGRQVTFWELTERSLDYAIEVTGTQIDDATRAALLDAYRELSPYPEVVATLTGLRDRGAKLAILSNGDPDLLERVVDRAGLAGTFDAVLSVVDAGTFKPHSAVYRLAVEAFDRPPQDIIFCSSNRWDIAGGAAFGFSCVWINRMRVPNEYPDLAPARVLGSLEGLLEPAINNR